mmetsp:Transcript_17306/g.47985  ORF Transcript_17306/g.47985 Transcript_17306/m.47985 type:complete len:90 (+) Transcript_17306:208-477(+)|eukprot:1157201-Pelagomonas_calceolata.AAC.2
MYRPQMLEIHDPDWEELAKGHEAQSIRNVTIYNNWYRSSRSSVTSFKPACWQASPPQTLAFTQHVHTLTARAYPYVNAHIVADLLQCKP